MLLLFFIKEKNIYILKMGMLTFQHKKNYSDISFSHTFPKKEKYYNFF